MDKIIEMLKTIENDLADLKELIEQVQQERNYDHFKDEQV